MKQPKRIPITEFATAERMPVDIIQRQANTFKKIPLLLEELTSPAHYVFVLNRQRQIVFASRNVHKLIPDKLRDQLLGLRPGEALNCIRSAEAEGGCGASESCRTCGALQAILSSLAGNTDLREFTLTRFIGCHQECRQFLALATPLVQNEEPFSVFALTESNNTKGRSAFEQLLPRQPDVQT